MQYMLIQMKLHHKNMLEPYSEVNEPKFVVDLQKKREKNYFTCQKLNQQTQNVSYNSMFTK